MPSLSEKLKSLGVQVGTQNISQPLPSNPHTIEKILSGHSLETHFGDTFVIEETYPADYQNGQDGLFNKAPFDIMAQWVRDEHMLDYPRESFVYLDTETTGLSGGSGTYAFLIGVGRFEGENFHLAQFFMRDPIEEPAQLSALEEFLAPCNALITYNGKSFDIPLLNSRFIYHGWRTPFNDLTHIDLLHLSRRLWRERLPSRTLGNIEVQILGTQRTEQDVPGWMIPQMYFDYLRNGDARPLKKVFYHNAMDILSLAALFHHSARLLSDPTNGIVEHGVDFISLARLFEDLGDLEKATNLYLLGINHEDIRNHSIPEEVLLRAILRLALIYKRQGKFKPAIELWKKATVFKDINAHVELAKYYEHKSREYDEAISWTETAINSVNAVGTTRYEQRQWIPELEHRLERLVRRREGMSTTPKTS